MVKERKYHYKTDTTHQHPGAPFEKHQYYTLEEARAELDISPKTMRKYIQDGNIVVRRLGGRIIILKSDLGEFLLNLPTVKALKDAGAKQ